MIVKFDRVWSMPSSATFTIKPIAGLISRYVSDGSGWCDPFAGRNSPAEWTNDLNVESPARFHLHSLTFCSIVPAPLRGVLFDPPYSLRQSKECYASMGLKLPYEETIGSNFSRERDALSDKVELGGLAICFGWNSGGFGLKRGFELIEGMLVAHGRGHNDTIVTVEIKVRDRVIGRV